MPEVDGGAVVESSQAGSSTTEPAKSEPTGTAAGQSKPEPTQRPDPALGTKSGDETEKRFKGIQADLQKERKARQAVEQEIARYKNELEGERRRVQALAGVAPRTTEDAEVEEIRARLAKIRPELADLTAEEIAEWREMAAERKTQAATATHYWATHGRTMVGAVQKEIATAYGGDLSDRQRDAILRAYVLRAQGDPEFLQRHEDGDQKLVKEFAKEWIEDWFEPARRRITASTINQHRPVPSGKDRGLVTQGEKKIDVNDAKAVEDILVAGFRERGGAFTR